MSARVGERVTDFRLLDILAGHDSVGTQLLVLDLVDARAELARLKSELGMSELNGEAITEARSYLVEHLGKDCERAFFDDCIHNVVARCLNAEKELARLREERGRLVEALRGYCTCVSFGGEPGTKFDCDKFPCRAGIALSARVLADAEGK